MKKLAFMVRPSTYPGCVWPKAEESKEAMTTRGMLIHEVLATITHMYHPLILAQGLNQETVLQHAGHLADNDLISVNVLLSRLKDLLEQINMLYNSLEIYTEVPLGFEQDGVYYCGTSDLVIVAKDAKLGSAIYIADYKTGPKPVTNFDQLAIYGLAASRQFNISPDKVGLFILHTYYGTSSKALTEVELNLPDVREVVKVFNSPEFFNVFSRFAKPSYDAVAQQLVKPLGLEDTGLIPLSFLITMVSTLEFDSVDLVRSIRRISRLPFREFEDQLYELFNQGLIASEMLGRNYMVSLNFDKLDNLW